ncbi:MAG: HU family DNA-binding protein [Gallionella sp.]|nr:HU family DNA-binding protein [Gallionella sp.]MDD4960181.1 HU family DNA-binding protein [Gallionella sp.]
MSDDNKIALPEFTELVAKRAKVSRIEADAFIHQFAKTLSKELEAGGEIPLYHFGRFHTTHIDEQAGRDPNSGVPLTIPAHTRVHFRAYNALRFAVNAPFRQLRIRELTPDKTAWRTRTGAWILLVLLILLLILLGMRTQNWITTQDVPVVVPVMSTAKTVMVQADPTPVASAPAIVLAEPVVPETTPTAAATSVAVSLGDTLWGIATTQLGDPLWWPVIYAENRPALSRHNPDHIDNGITLRIPALVGSVSSPNIADLLLKTKSYQIVAKDYHKHGNPRAAAYKRAAARLAKE